MNYRKTAVMIVAAWIGISLIAYGLAVRSWGRQLNSSVVMSDPELTRYKEPIKGVVSDLDVEDDRIELELESQSDEFIVRSSEAARLKNLAATLKRGDEVVLWVGPVLMVVAITVHPGKQGAQTFEFKEAWTIAMRELRDTALSRGRNAMILGSVLLMALLWQLFRVARSRMTRSIKQNK